jgi:hypothetical protein
MIYFCVRAYRVKESGACATVLPPTLKWQRGGCYSSWCETGWYSSLAVVDLDNDGVQDVIVIGNL